MKTLRDSLDYEPVELNFGTSGLRGLVKDMTDLECYINTLGFGRFLSETAGVKRGTTVFVAGDLRDSTPRILRAVVKGVRDAGFEAEYFGLIPTPALAHHAFSKAKPCIMVTGSHIPADRNGIKFYKVGDEVLKADETAIKAAVAKVRAEVYESDVATTTFDNHGMLTVDVELPEEDMAAHQAYLKRYVSIFGTKALAGKKIVFYQHSAVGRDLLVDLLEKLGAEVIPVGRSEVFVPIDTENVKPSDREYFEKTMREHEGAFAMVSTDGDSDRPFVIDERGVFNRGDVLGVVVSQWLEADFAAFPVSSSDAVDRRLTDRGVDWVHTKIGSPYVVVAMKEAVAKGRGRVVGWEVNGGFLTGMDLEVGEGRLSALPTRDAALPIVVALVAAAERGVAVSDLFGELPQRYTQAGLIDDFPVRVSTALVKRLLADDEETRSLLRGYFTEELGFGEIVSINVIDGVRIYFDNGDIAHIRPSGNAPQLRIYSVAASQKRADEIVAVAVAEPDGILRRMQGMIED